MAQIFVGEYLIVNKENNEAIDKLIALYKKTVDIDIAGHDIVKDIESGIVILLGDKAAIMLKTEENNEVVELLAEDVRSGADILFMSQEVYYPLFFTVDNAFTRKVADAVEFINHPEDILD